MSTGDQHTQAAGSSQNDVSVVDEWDPWCPLFAGALHLTHSEVA